MADQVVTASPESFRLQSDKVIVTGHGIDTNLFQPGSTPRPPNEPFTILSVGRIAPVKRIEGLIEAARLLAADDMPAFQVRIVGEAAPLDADAAYSEKLRQQVAAAGLENAVRFVGGVSHEQVVNEYQCADVMVNLSNTGSIDKAVLEAMACALPVLTSNEAFQEMLTPWSDSLWLPDSSSETLALRLKEWIAQSPQLRRALGLQLREIVVEQHSLDKLIVRLVEILQA